MSDQALLDQFKRIRNLGFAGIEIDTYFYMNSDTATTLFEKPSYNPSIHWTRTPEDSELRRMLRLAHSSGLKTWLRPQVQLSEAFINSVNYFVTRGNIQPSSTSEWFTNYGKIVLDLAVLAESEDVDILDLGIELETMQQYHDEWNELANRVRDKYSGNLSYSEATNVPLSHYSSCSGTAVEQLLDGRFWDPFDQIAMNVWPISGGCFFYSEESDQSLSSITETYYGFWQEPFDYYREQHPDKPISLGEVGSCNCDGTLESGYQTWNNGQGDTDYLEVADFWAAVLVNSELLGIRRVAAWTYWIWSEELPVCNHFNFKGTPAEAVIASFMKGLLETSENPWFAPQILSTAPAKSTLILAAHVAHPARVMQGISDHKEIFAMPLNGIPELSFYPVTEPDLLPLLTWSAQSSDPDGIGAEIEGGTLYIWGASSTWSGRGEVTLTAEDPYGNQASITIPVTVFEADRTFVNEEGVTEYYVPWDPQLDINRILSVEEHMHEYAKDEGSLDRTVRFSPWRKMEYMKGGQLFGFFNEYTSPPYTESSWRLAMDNLVQELIDLGCDSVLVSQNYLQPSREAPRPIAVYERYPAGGVTLTEEQLCYVIDECHRNGLQVLLQYHVHEVLGTDRSDWDPPDWDEWFRALAVFVEDNAVIAQRCGANAYVMGNNLHVAISIERGVITNESWVSHMVHLVKESARTLYQGPISYLPGALDLPRWSELGRIDALNSVIDIIGGNANIGGLVETSSPTVDEIVEGLVQSYARLFAPLVAQHGKPMITNEGWMMSIDGAIADYDCIGIPGPDAQYDGQEQADWYEAWFRAESEYPYLFGFGLSVWPATPGQGGSGDKWQFPRLKPAQQQIEIAYRGSIVERAVQLDGQSTEWLMRNAVLDDDPDDALGTPDIESTGLSSDERYVYVLVELSEALDVRQNLNVYFDLDSNGIDDMAMALGLRPYDLSRYWSALYADAQWKEHRGEADIVDSNQGDILEIRIPWLFVDEATSLSMRVDIWDDPRKVIVDQAGPISLTGSATFPSSVQSDTATSVESQTTEAPSETKTLDNLAVLSTTPQAIEVIDKTAYIIDWSSGQLQSVDTVTEVIKNLADDFSFVTDIASDGETLIIVSEEGSAWSFDAETNESTPLDLGVSINGEVLGVAHYEDTLYLLLYGPTGPVIQAIHDGQSTTTPIQIATTGELISLQLWKGSLLTLDYAAGIGYRLVDIGDSYTLERAFDITDYVTAEEQASGGVRGFFLTDDVYYFTSMSLDSEPGKLHIVPVAPDPLATSLQDWVLTDFGAATGVLGSLTYGEDNHGSYLSFSNPSGGYNAILQLWSDTSDHDLSAATAFFLDAVSLGESTDMFVEFIHDDAAYSEGAIFMNNEHDVFTLPESGGLTIALDDLSCSEDTAFPWSDVDGVMLHFRPSTAEIRFYGFCSALQDRCPDCVFSLSHTGPDGVPENVPEERSTVSLHIINPLTDAGIADAYVQLETDEETVLAATRTDKDGRCTFPNAPINREELWVRIEDEQGDGIGSYFDRYQPISSEEADEIVVYLIPDLGIQSAGLAERYTTFLEMLQRNTGNELAAVTSEDDIIGPLDTLHHGWGDQITVYVGQEYNGTHNWVREVINELNSQRGFEYLRQVNSTSSADWIFDYSDMGIDNWRSIASNITFQDDAEPASCQLRVGGLFVFDTDFKTRLRETIITTLLLNEDWHDSLLAHGKVTPEGFVNTSFSRDATQLMAILATLPVKRDFAYDCNELNMSPIAIVPRIMQVRWGDDVVMDASLSNDPEGQNLVYSWEQLFAQADDSEYMTNHIAQLGNSHASTASFLAEWPGNYRFQLTVTDEHGASDSGIVDVQSFAGEAWDRMQGVCTFAYWDSNAMPVVDTHILDDLVSRGVNWIEFAPLGWMKDGTSNQVERLGSYYPGCPGLTVSDAELEKLVGLCHERGLKVFLRPTIENYYWIHWRGGLTPGNWTAWFDSYTDWILHYAELVADLDIEMFDVFNELHNAMSHEAECREVIRAVAEVLPDSTILTLSAADLDWENPDAIRFWDEPAIDQIGIDFYPTTPPSGGADSTPPYSAYVESMQETFRKLEAIHTATGKPVAIHETGWVNAASSSAIGGGWIQDVGYPENSIDNRQPTRFLESVFEVASTAPWIEGVFVFSRALKKDFNYQKEDLPVSHEIAGRPTEDLIRFWYGEAE